MEEREVNYEVCPPGTRAELHSLRAEARSNRARLDRFNQYTIYLRQQRDDNSAARDREARRAAELERENERLREANRVGRDHLRELDAHVRRETDILREVVLKIATTRPHYVYISVDLAPKPDKTAYFWLGREADHG